MFLKKIWFDSLCFERFYGQGLNRRTTKISNLYSNILYLLRVRAVNEKGVGEPSPPSRGIITLPKAPTRLVQNVTGGGGKQATLVIRWVPLDYVEQNGNGFYYMLKWKSKLDAEFTLTRVYEPQPLPDSNEVQHTISLPKEVFYKPYEVTIEAVNDQVGKVPFEKSYCTIKLYRSFSVFGCWRMLFPFSALKTVQLVENVINKVQ